MEELAHLLKCVVVWQDGLELPAMKVETREFIIINTDEVICIIMWQHKSYQNVYSL